jgi:ubiquinone/menaquinone biosynthesis C-methylase UbiE
MPKVGRAKSGRKIYGYDEELWCRLLLSNYETGERDVGVIEGILRRLSPGKEILDLGCGTGRISNRLAAMGYSVTGIDACELCIREARRLAEELGVSKNVSYIVGDYRSLDIIPAKEFDAALCILASAWNSMEEMSAIFGNISHRMKKGAILLLKEFVKERFLTLLHLAPSLQNWFRMEGDMLYLHRWRYVPRESKVITIKELYRREAKDFKFVARIEREYSLPSLTDYIIALERAGWQVEEVIEEPVDLMRLEIYNDPWWLFSSLIVARLIVR